MAARKASRAAKDRAAVVVKDLEDLAVKRATFQSLLKQWITCV